MHVPQIRSFGHGAEVRRFVRAAVEHREREDIRILVVLVRAADRADRIVYNLPRRHRDERSVAVVFAARAISSVAAEGYPGDRRQIPVG